MGNGYSSPSGKDVSSRWTIGLHVDERLTRLEAALVCMRGRHVGAPLEIRKQLDDEIPSGVAMLYRQLVDGVERGTLSELLGVLADLRRDLGELLAVSVAELLGQGRVAPADLLAVGVNDPGLWTSGENEGRGYEPLADLAFIAERTGANVIGAFPSRDVAREGRGGPIMPLPDWVLLRASARHRLALELGPTVRGTYLPKASLGNPRDRILAFDIAPGMSLAPDDWTPNEEEASSIETLLEAWLALHETPRGVPHWRPHGGPVRAFLDAAANYSAAHGDAIAGTIARFIAEAVGRMFDADGPLHDADVGDIILLGELADWPLLQTALKDRLPNMQWLRPNDLGVPNGGFRAITTALLTFLYLDQVPASLPLVTGADVSRVLGELAPGSPGSWQRLLEEFSGTKATIRPLRSAL